jgi:membrane protein involved in colicin uptake
MNIYSTLQANKYNDRKGELIAQINNGNNAVTDKTLSALKQNAAFNQHLEGGYLTIGKSADDAETKAQKDATEKAEREANERADIEAKRLAAEAEESKRLADEAEKQRQLDEANKAADAEKQRQAEAEKKAAEEKAQKELDDANAIANKTGGKK